jgi:histidinol phosphatase-like enzyme
VRSLYEPEVPFIDRDGTLISEPPSDYQVDRFDKLAFEPDAIPVLLATKGRLQTGDDH